MLFSAMKLKVGNGRFRYNVQIKAWKMPSLLQIYKTTDRYAFKT